MEKFLVYTDFIMAIAMLLLWLTMVAIILIMWIGSRIE